MSKSRVVFVGNISYDLSEEQLTDVLKEVGPVVSFRMVFDRETGKPKGYGFCEYKDTETAQSAIRNLNNVELGGRNLRVDIADSPNVSSSTNSISSLNNNPSFTTTTASSSSLLNAVESINTTLSSLTSTQLLDLLSQMKSLIASSPDAARHLLNSNPQLSYALLQSMLILGIVDVNAIQNLSSPQNMQQSFEPTSQMIQQQPTSQLPSIEQQRQALMQIMSYTQEQLDALPPEQKQQIMLLRSQYAAASKLQQ